MASSSSKQKLVHLDLKGAPPRVEYYEKFFPLIKKLGATGVLMEYEDMFPYWGHLTDIPCSCAYSKEGIERILQIAADNSLTVIPLVQTFGHFEFVLKHEKFCSLREIPNFPMALCPSNPDSVIAVTMMIDQVVQLHPGIRWFHIGADEVYHMGICEKCKKKMAEENLSKHQLMFKHIRTILEYIKTNHPDIVPIMWDDMLRFIELPVLLESGLGELVDVMVWHYMSTFYLPPDIWDKFSKVFSNIWFASAFKGATGSSMYITNVRYHIENHLAWLQVVDKESFKIQNFRGFALTGWQRYDHYAILCELLPQGIPSLAICLSVLDKGSFSYDIHKDVSDALKSSCLIPVNPIKMGELPRCHFPGAEVYTGMLEFFRLDLMYEDFMHNESRVTWMNEYHMKRNFANPVHVEPIYSQGIGILESLQQLYNRLRPALLEIFYQETVEEWLAIFLGNRIRKLSEIIDAVRNNVTSRLSIMQS